MPVNNNEPEPNINQMISVELVIVAMKCAANARNATLSADSLMILFVKDRAQESLNRKKLMTRP